MNGVLALGMACCRPLARPAAWIARRQRERPPKNIVRLNVPVISVGNLTFGGTGKTPTVERLAELLKSRGHRVGVVMRGYRAEKRSKEGWTLVSDGFRLLSELAFAGDEAFLFARAHSGVAVAVGRRKAFVAERLTKTVPRDVLLLDDGFQHHRLHRDADVVLLDARKPFGNGRVLPAGPLREPPEALHDADLILLSHADYAENLDALQNIVESYAPGVPVVVSRHVPWSVSESISSEKHPPDVLKGKEVIAVSGIASPERFVQMLHGLGACVVATRTFPDHHRYTDKDLETLNRLARQRPLVTTAKDAIKWEGRVSFPFMTLEIRVEWSPMEPIVALLSSLGL